MGQSHVGLVHKACLTPAGEQEQVFCVARVSGGVIERCEAGAFKGSVTGLVNVL